jgi:hypothetical protein
MIMAYDIYDTFGIGVNTPTLQSATFYKNKIYYGADFLRMSMNATVEVETDYESGYGYNDETDNGDGKISINMLMPRLGYRKPFKEMGSVQTYNQIEGYLIIPMLKSSGDFKLEGDAHEEITDALSLMGFKASHSVEYNFTEQLSLVADVGLNWIFWDSFTDDEYEGYNYTEKTQTELNIHLGMTYSKLSLHFKF